MKSLFTLILFLSITGTLFSQVGIGTKTPNPHAVLDLKSPGDDQGFLVPRLDGMNEFLRILNIENFPENTFTVFTRWGDKIFEIKNYDNKERVFRGKSNMNGEKDLVNGTYFYVIETKDQTQKLNGFLSLKN